MSTFVKKDQLGLVNGGYLVITEGEKAVTNEKFVDLQVQAHYLVTLAEKVKGSNFKATEVANFAELKRKVSEEIEKEEVRIDRNLARMPGFEKDLRGIIRQQEIKETLYIYLLQKREEAQIALAVGIGNAKIVDSAYSNGSIVSPRKTFIYAGSLVFALLFGIVIIYLGETLYDKVNSKQDIERVKLPFIGNIPLGQAGQQIVISRGSKTAISEAFRTLRTNVDFILKNKKGPKFIFVTYSVAKEGKSFTAVNLSLSIALSNKKVLLVGLDL